MTASRSRQAISMHMTIDSLGLVNSRAQALYADYARTCPIYDFHSHLDVRRFAENRAFRDLSDLWIDPDPYKWRAMRMAGVPEHLITGDVDPYERFQAWATTLPKLTGNPVQIWSRMELRQYFGIEEALGTDHARAVWEATNARLQQDVTLRPQALLRQAGFAAWCSSDAWLDDRQAHRQAQAAGLQPRLLPSLRADQALACGPGYADFLQSLGRKAGIAIRDLDSLIAALRWHLDDLQQLGCRIADHGMDQVDVADSDPQRAEHALHSLMCGEAITHKDCLALRSTVFLTLSREYQARGWTLLWHIGAKRATSTRLARAVPGAGGYASIGDHIDIDALVRLLDAMEQHQALPRTILFPLAPVDLEALACLSGSFIAAGEGPLLQLGPAWWYNDHRGGITRQLAAVAQYGVLGLSVGMTTDSRSFLSGVRHDYFRRLLCSQLAEWIELGELADDQAMLQELIDNICWRQAARIMALAVPEERT